MSPRVDGGPHTPKAQFVRVLGSSAVPALVILMASNVPAVKQELQGLASRLAHCCIILDRAGMRGMKGLFGFKVAILV